MQDTVKEIVPAIAHTSGNVSDAEGSAIGDFIGLKPPERKRKEPGDQQIAEISLRMMTGVQKAKG